MVLGIDGPSFIFISLTLALVVVTFFLMTRVTELEKENNQLKNRLLALGEEVK